MIKTKVLLKAMTFMCLPTLSLLTVIFIGFFSVSKFVAFVTSDNGWAIFMRVVLVLAELVLVVIMYDHYLHEYEEEEALKKAKEHEGTGEYQLAYGHRTLSEIFPQSGNSRNSHAQPFKMYSTANKNVKVIQYEEPATKS